MSHSIFTAYCSAFTFSLFPWWYDYNWHIGFLLNMSAVTFLQTYQGSIVYFIRIRETSWLLATMFTFDRRPHHSSVVKRAKFKHLSKLQTKYFSTYGEINCVFITPAYRNRRRSCGFLETNTTGNNISPLPFRYFRLVHHVHASGNWLIDIGLDNGPLQNIY